MFCKNCGNEIQEKSTYCDNCGAQLNSEDIVPKTPKEKYMFSFVLGLIGSILAFFSNSNIKAFLFVGVVLGIIGACICRKKLRTGSIMELISSGIVFIAGLNYSGIVATLILLSSGIIGMVLSRETDN